MVSFLGKVCAQIARCPTTRIVIRNGIKYTIDTLRPNKASVLAQKNFNRKLEETTQKRLELELKKINSKSEK
jgi:hypothetical protein